MNDPRLFADVPRGYITLATVLGGIIGLLLSQAFQWDIVPTFVATLGIAIGCIVVVIVLYRVFRRPTDKKTKS